VGAPFTHIRLALVLAFFLVLGAIQGTRLEATREAEAFFRWVNAAAVNERVFRDEASGVERADQDDELYAELITLADPLLGDIPVPTVAGDDRCVSKVCLMASDPAFDDRLWQLSTSREMAPLRERFLALARENKLAYAQGIAYAEAQQSGVNIFNLFFGFRKVAANFLWLQVDRFWHQGMYWRMIPLMKTCVALDPNFVDAYLLGAWHLSYNATAKMPDTPMRDRVWHPKYEVCVGEKEKYYYFGVDFLRDGIRNNPRDYRLYFDLGFAVYRMKLEDYANAVKYLTEAIRHPHQRWVPRQLYECLEMNGQYEEALQGWEDYNARFPDTTDVAPRFIIRNKAHIAEQAMVAKREEAAAATDEATRAALMAEAEALERETRARWAELDEPYGQGRLLRLDALRLAEQERYLEAVALLDKARNESSKLFWEASDLIIEFKQRGGMPLSLSEKKAVLRKEQGEDCAGRPEGAGTQAG
jgi:hypothetical protein